ncbi:MAG: class I SAM-dependent methyltransferase [Gammaproteobacteria bacterium]
MRNRIFAVAFSVAILALAAAPLARAADTQNVPANPTLQQAVNGAWRTPAYVKRDKYRHPVKVLEFFGLKPDMTVVELEPAGGWWTEFLAPYLKAKGHLIETVPPASSKGSNRTRTHFLAKLKASPALYSKITTAPFAPPKTVTLGPPDSADMVLTFRNIHDWVNEHNGAAKAVFVAAFKVLKPGGVFGVVSHRALPYANPVTSAHDLHRLPEDFVIQLGLNAGFRLAAVSEVNKNPKDSLMVNVHHLPPDLDMGDTAAQKKKYEKVGESDRMTFRFVKPKTSRRMSGSVGGAAN